MSSLAFKSQVSKMFFGLEEIFQRILEQTQSPRFFDDFQQFYAVVASPLELQ